MITTIGEGVFVKIPKMVGSFLRNISRNKSLYWILGMIVVLVSLSVFIFITAEGLAGKLKTTPSWSVLLYALPFFYGAYLVITAPIFFLFAYLKTGSMTRGMAHERKIRFTRKQMNVSREKAIANQVFLGRSMQTRQNCYLSTETRKMHCHVVGSTGSGKTDSLILPLFVQDIERGRGVLVMDAKGDRETLNKIYHHVKRVGREKDFLFFSLAYPEKSNTYNPLLRGNPTELKDKIISANIWTEEFYKKKAEETLLLLMKCMRDVNEIVTFQKLYDLLTNEKNMVDIARRLNNRRLQDLMLTILKKYPLFQKDLAGMTADLGMIAESEFARLLTDEKPEIDLLNAYQKKQIVYFQLNTQGYEETARRFGRIVLQDLKTISNYIQAYMPEKERSFFPIYVDEFSNFAYEAFIEFLNKARGAHFGITMAHQSLGDLEKAGAPFVKQVLENSNIKIIMRQDDPQSIETYSRISGTEKTFKDTVQTEEDFISKSPTGMVSVRIVDEFRLKPNTIRELKRGEAAVIIKHPLLVDVLQLDYAGEVPQEEYVKLT